MLRTRVARRAIDTQRLGRALARPGMDTRCWVCEAEVVAFKLDPDEGAFADITIIPSGEPETVRVGAFYAGPGFGFYAPLEKNDHVLVAFPDADPDQGGVIVARLWSASDPPSDTAKDNDADISIHVKEGTNLRIAVTGGGKVLMGAAGEATKPVAREGDKVNIGYFNILGGVGPAFGGLSWTPSGGGTPVVIPIATPWTPIASELDGGKVSEGSSVVEASD